MRIAYLTGEYPRATDTFIQREVASLREAGAEVQTFAVRRPAKKENVGPEQAAEQERTTYLLPPSVAGLLTAHLGLLLKTPARFGRAIRLAWRTRAPGVKASLYQFFYFMEAGLLAHHLQAKGIDHLHNHFANSSCSVAMLASELSGVPFSFTMHGPAIFFEPERWRIGEKARRARFVACISHYCRSQAMIFAPLEAWPHLHIIHCGVDPAMAQRAQHTEGKHRLLFVGRLAAVKGLPMLLEAVSRLLARMPTLELTLVGDGPDRAALEQHAARLGLGEHVKFVGYQSQSAVAQRLAETDVFVLPSFAEGVPVVLMEAMAAGVPVVATRIAGVGELVEEGVSGYLVPPGDAVSLADRIERLLGDAALRARLGEAGRARVERDFDVRREAQRLLRLFRGAAEGEPQPIRPALPDEAAGEGVRENPAVYESTKG